MLPSYPQAQLFSFSDSRVSTVQLRLAVINYDFIQLNEHKWVICLRDISGKGLPASLLMSNLQALIRGELPWHNSPGTLLKNANDELFENTDTEKFATLFIGILNTSTDTFTYSNAGHEYPFLIHFDASYSRLKKGGLPLGVMDNQTFEEETIELQSGDKLITYSDGITDSFDNKNKSFGENRLAQLLIEQADQKREEIIENIFDASMEHSWIWSDRRRKPNAGTFGGVSSRKQRGKLITISVMEQIEWKDFEKVELRIGTIIDVKEFPEAHDSTYKLRIDFGDEIGIKKSSSQITDLYTRENLLDKQVIVVVNFPPKQIGPFISECLVTGFYRDSDEVVLAVPDKEIPNGAKLA